MTARCEGSSELLAPIGHETVRGDGDSAVTGERD